MAYQPRLLLLVVGFLWSFSSAIAVEPDFSALTIHSPQDAESQRTLFTERVFGSSTLPAVLPQVDGDGDQLVYQLPQGFTSNARLYTPTQPNQDLLIYHHGHFTDAQIANIEQAVLNHFLPAGYSVLFVSMPLYGPNKDPRYPNPVSHDKFYAQTPNAIRYFLEPVVAFVNYLEPSYRRIVMVGLSGGGWTTVVYSALDTRIAKSYPVAGSYPGYVTRAVPMSRDAEQKDSALYNGIDYLDLYAIAGMRHQYQFFNYYDPCCFFGDYGKQYEAAVADRVRPYGGSFSVFVDYANTMHSISEQAYSLILDDLATQTPYTGTPANIPGMVQAEDFDDGGEGVAYHDVDRENWRDNVYRTSAVEVAPTTDSGRGYNIGYTRTGEWLEYTVNVASAGYYMVEARVASAGSGGTFRLEFNGIDKTGSFTVPNTGGWQSWRTLSKTGVFLNAGQQVMRLYEINAGASGSVANINWVRFTATSATGQTPYTGTPANIPGMVQAEDFDNGGENVAYHDVDPENWRGDVYRTSAVEVAPTTDTGGGYNIGYTRTGEWLEYTVNVATAGYYTVEARIASLGNGGTFRLEFNGVDKTGLFTVPNTGGWQTWRNLSKTGVFLNAGQQVMRLYEINAGASGSVANINWVRFTAMTNMIPGTIQSEDFDQGSEGVAYHDTDATNNGGAYRETGVDIQATQDVGGGYDVGWTRAGEWLRYTVNIAASGYYTLEARVASSGLGGSFHIELDGVVKTDPFAVPNTGGWQKWTTLIRRGVYLESGQHTLRLIEDAVGPSGSIGNINWLRFTAE